MTGHRAHPPFSVRPQLAEAIASVNTAYSELSEDERPDVGWDEVDDALEVGLRSHRQRGALEAIATWRSHWLGVFSEVTR